MAIERGDMRWCVFVDVEIWGSFSRLSRSPHVFLTSAGSSLNFHVCGFQGTRFKTINIITSNELTGIFEM